MISWPGKTPHVTAFTESSLTLLFTWPLLSTAVYPKNLRFCFSKPAKSFSRFFGEQKNSAYAFWYTKPSAGPQPTYGSVLNTPLQRGWEFTVRSPSWFALFICLRTKFVSGEGPSLHHGSFFTFPWRKLTKTLETSSELFGVPHIP